MWVRGMGSEAWNVPEMLMVCLTCSSRAWADSHETPHSQHCVPRHHHQTAVAQPRSPVLGGHVFWGDPQSHCVERRYISPWRFPTWIRTKTKVEISVALGKVKWGRRRNLSLNYPKYKNRELIKCGMRQDLPHTEYVYRGKKQFCKGWYWGAWYLGPKGDWLSTRCKGRGLLWLLLLQHALDLVLVSTRSDGMWQPFPDSEVPA